MKKFKSPAKNIGYLIYRIVSPVFDPIHFVEGLKGYVWFTRDLIEFKKQGGTNIKFIDFFPSLHDKTSHTPFDAHYFHQQLWCFDNINKNKPAKHVDVASTYEMSGYISKIVPTVFVDIRPFDVNLEGLKVLNGSITNLPFEDSSLESVSCLHVLEHIGLGRYGDPVDIEGTTKSVKELSRVVKSGGYFYFSTPVGKKRICFNSHNIFDPLEILEMFSAFELQDFSYVSDEGNLIKEASPRDCIDQNYACGLYLFRKK